MKVRKFKNTILTAVAVLPVVLMGWIISGCTKDSTSEPALSSGRMVNMAISFSKSGTSGLAKTSSDLFIDSLHIDSAMVVFSRIQFLPHEDTAKIDSGDDDHDSRDNDWDHHNDSLSFKGPFVVHVRDTVGINFASKELPSGIYDGIKFKIRRLVRDEHHEDSDEHNHHHLVPTTDSTIVGSSITVWGSIYKNGKWTAFMFLFDGEFEFKIRGDFVVPASTSTVNIALNIDMGKWFINPFNGSLLDPTDTSHANRKLFRRAIRSSFDSCKGGHDRGDGHPDD
jgi:hypothetical protein